MSNKKFLLPYGDGLREFLSEPGITRADIKSILRRRGVFFSSDDKTNTVPLLIKTGLSPFELEELQDKIKTKEDNPKVHTQSIPWSGGNRSLIDVMPADLNVNELIDQPFSNYKVIGAPNFRSIKRNPNHIEMDFKIERYDLTKSWDKNTSQFSGRITLKRGSGDVNVSMSLSHTAPETKFVVNRISKNVIREMKDHGVIDKDASVKKIRFNDFKNSDRIAFMQELSQQQVDPKLYFKDTRDIGFRPDKTQALPNDISWMEEKIKNLILQGSDLHATFFVKDKKYHQYLEVYKIDADYSFEFDDYSGCCRISFEFNDFIARERNDAELSIKVINLSFDSKSVSVSSNKVKERLLAQLESGKLKLHEKYRKTGL